MERAERRRVDPEGGVAAVEFALVLPILVTVLLAIVEYGYGLARQQVVTNAAREGVRAGLTRPDLASAATVAGQTSRNYLARAGITAAADPTLNVQVTTPTVAGSGAVQVQITVGWKKLTGFPLIPTPARNRATAVMRIF